MSEHQPSDRAPAHHLAAAPGPLVVGVDGSDRAADAIALACLLGDALAARLLLAFVFVLETPYPRGGLAGYAALAAALSMDGEELLANAQRAAGGRASTEALVASSPARGLQDLAERERAAMIVLGSSHRGPLGRVLIGSVSERCLTGAPCPVAVTPRGWHQRQRPLRRIAVAYDGSPEADMALELAWSLAVPGSGTVALWCALAPTVWQQHEEFAAINHEWADSALERATAAAPAGIPLERRILEGDPAEVMREAAAREDIDLLITGSRGYGPMRRVLLGGLATTLMRSAPCPLVAVPRPRDVMSAMRSAPGAQAAAGERGTTMSGQRTSRTSRPETPPSTTPASGP